MGGIGKTTIARTIFEDCKNDFEGSCFLKDVRQSNYKLVKLQKQLLSDVLKKQFERIHDVDQGSSIIQERLQFKKVLLVIDDVDDREQLDVIVKEPYWFGRGSVIIVTTRDDHLLEDNYIKTDCQILSKRDSLHLFCLHAFKNDHPPEDYKKLSLQVLTYDGGLPLTLQVLGDHLYRRESLVWKSTLSRLKDLPKDKIISKLHITFDGLNLLHQNIFLDIACFFRGYPKYKVEKQLQSLGFHPEEAIDMLVRKSLIYINAEDNFYEYCYEDDDDHNGSQAKYFIEMHDKLQEMGWYIVRQRVNWDVRRYSRLWLENDLD